MSAIEADPELSEQVVVIVTADHGGVPDTTKRTDRLRPENFIVPFPAWGPGINPGDLYALNPDYQNPGKRQPEPNGPQPVGNGDVANLVLLVVRGPFRGGRRPGHRRG